MIRIAITHSMAYVAKRPIPTLLCPGLETPLAPTTIQNLATRAIFS